MVARLEDEKEKLQKLIEVMLEMTDASTVEELWDLLYKGAALLVDAPHIAISRLDDSTGELKVVKSDHERRHKLLRLKIGEGITGTALKSEHTIRVDDVWAEEWKGVYKKFWTETRSEIALPIVVYKVPIRVGREVKIGTKALGVLNLESAQVGAFSEEDEERLQLLVRHAAILVERRESDEKLRRSRKIEKQVPAEKDTSETVKVLFKGITEILKFEFVNVSLVNVEKNSIDTKYVIGISENEEQKFKRMASHSLSGNDIQADIVRFRQIEAPNSDDPRFDRAIFKQFKHGELIRVFLPMIEFSSGRVVGTLEAAYQRSYRKFIYERDVQILENFVDHIVQALERDKSDVIDRIMHELRSPIVGIRSNAELLQRRMNQLSQDRIDLKLEDILIDCEMLLHQVGSLEYVFSGRRKLRKLSIRRVDVFRDVVLKIFYQLKPIITEMGFSLSGFTYNKQDNMRVIVSSDPVQLNQVVYNLLINSIKYAEADPTQFRILINVSENRDFFIIQFKDWGIGISEKYKHEIFKRGFRTPEATQKNVTGSGLGLAISRAIMHELGGDLQLVRCSKPTEIHMLIPKDFQKNKIGEL